MVRTFCDRCGRVVAGVSKLGSMTVRAENERGGEIVTLDFCAFCADWAIGTLMRRTMLGKGEEKQERAMDNLEFDLTAGKLRKKGEKKGSGKDEWRGRRISYGKRKKQPPNRRQNRSRSSPSRGRGRRRRGRSSKSCCTTNR